MTRRPIIFAAAALALALVAAGCGDDETTTDSASGGADTSSCAKADLALKESGKLTVATGEPAFEPWVVDDDPTNGKGYEAAVVDAVAAELGLAKGDVTWTRTGFDEAVAPGTKDFDFNVQQYSITVDRKKVVDFSDGYYTVEQAIIGRADGPFSGAKTLTDLEDARLGAAIGTTSLDYIDEFIKPTTQPLAFDDNAAAKAAFDADQVDAIVFDLPTAYYITAVEIEGSSIIGVLPQQGPAEELGFLFEKDSKLVDCVNQALGKVKTSGKLDELDKEWLNQGGDIPTLEK